MRAYISILIGIMVMLPSVSHSQVYKQDFGTTTINTHPFTGTPVIMDQYLSNSVWTNAPLGAWTSYTHAPGVAIGLANTANSPVITLTFNVASNKQLSISGFNFWRQRSGSGPQNWTLSINGTQVGTGTTPTTGAEVGDTNVSSPIINLTGTVTVTLSLTNGGASGATFRLDDFTLYGTVTASCTQPVISSVLPLSGPANTQVTLTGTGFTGASSVTLNGTAVTYQVISDTQLKLTVPQGGSNGVIKVTTNSCESDPSSAFTYTTGECAPSTGLTELFISEVYDDQAGEGGVIEIYNPTVNTVDMSQYAIDHYTDWANASPVSTNALVGMLPPGGIYLVKRTQGLTCTATSLYTSTLNEGFNDNDKLDLTKNGVVIDRVRTPTNTGYSLNRLNTATPLPSATYIAAQWNINNTESCSNVGIYSMPGTPQASITTQPQSTSTCNGNSATFTVAISGGTGFAYQWKTLDASGNWVNVTDNAIYSGSQTATLAVNASTSLNNSQYYVQITSATCTLISNAAALTVGSGPATPTFNATIITCLIPTSVLTVVPVAGLEYSIDGTNYNTTGIFTGLSAGTLTLYVRDANGCVTTTPVTISVSVGIPDVPTYTATALTCTVATATITVDPITGLEYSIDGTNFSSNNVFTGLVADTYTITVRNTAGCTNSVQVIIAPAPLAPAVPTYTATALTCTVATATITVDPVTGLEYSIDGTNFSSNNVFTGLVADTYTITVRNADGCTNSVQVIIAPAPLAPAVPTYTATALTCTVATATITVDPVTGLEYSIDGTNFSSNNVFTGLVADTYTITVRNADGCTNAVQVIIAPAPLAPAVPTYTATALTCTVATATITVDPVTGLEYSIDGTNFSSNNVFTGLVADTYTITVRNADGCTNAVQVIIAPAPLAPAVPTYTATALTCAVTTATITVDPVTGLEYSIDGTNFSSNNVFTGLIADTYTITVRNAAGCTNAVQVIIAPAPLAPAVPTYTATALTCTVTTATITVDPVTGLEYSIDGTNFSSNNVFTGLVADTYTITVRNAAGCTNSVQVIIAPAPLAPAVPTYTATALTCTITTATITVDPVTGLEYSIDGTNFSSNNVFTGLTANTYTITVRNAAGCTNSIQVIIAPAPSAPAVPTYTATAITCAVNTATITVNAVTGLEYSIDGTNFSSNNVFTGLTSDNYTITVRNVAGCTNSVTVNIASAPLMPSFDTFEGCTQTTSGRHFIFELISEGNFDFDSLDYKWKTTSGTTVSTDGPEFDVTEYASSANISAFPISLSLEITTAEGCTQTYNFEAAGTACDIPRGISPNGDNRNDEFDLSGMNVQHLTIFNRYGLEVYHKANYIKEWYGQTDKGDNLPTGTYFYVVKTASESKTGWVYINRQD